MLLILLLIHGYTYHIDVCHMGIFFQTWFCGGCGLELCGRCHQDLSDDQELDPSLPCLKIHSKTRLFPVSSFLEAELTDTIREMETLTVSSPVMGASLAFQDTDTSMPDTQPIRRFKSGDLTNEQLDILMSGAEPFVLTDVIKPGSPSELLDLTNDCPHPCKTTYFDGTGWCDKDCTLEKYFSRWEVQHEEVRIFMITGKKSLTIGSDANRHQKS